MIDKNNGYSHLRCRNHEKNHLTFECSYSPIVWVFLNSKPLLTDDVNKDKNFLFTDDKRTKPRSIVASPITISDQTVGVLSVVKNEYGYFNEIDKQMVRSLANHLSFAIERDRGLELLEKIGERIISAEKLELILKEIVVGAKELTNTDTGIIFLLNDDASEIISEYYPEEDFHLPPRLSEAGITKHVFVNKRILVIKDIAEDKLVNPHLKKEYKSLIAVPLLLQDKVIGVLFLNDKKFHDFSDTEKSFLSTLTKQAVIAIEKAKLMEQIRSKLNQTEEQNIALHKLLSLNTLTAAFFHRIRSSINYVPSHIDDIKQKINDDKITKVKLFEKLDDIQKGANTILDRAERVSRSVKKIPSHPYLIKDVVLKKLIRNIIGGIQKDKLENIQIDLTFTAYPVIVETFPSLLKEALLNIIANAIESMEEAGGVLNIILNINQYKKKEFAILDIIDTGIGIEKSNLKSIFEIHYSTKKEGFGYGLWYVDMVFKASGIDFDLKSEINKGTIFTLYIPLKAKEKIS